MCWVTESSSSPKLPGLLWLLTTDAMPAVAVAEPLPVSVAELTLLLVSHIVAALCTTSFP
eukprot:m.283173 g.283173  ORF g.283173 m.283173 type:complete len:60 (-) comp19411_c0_seq6:114-293(-)